MSDYKWYPDDYQLGIEPKKPERALVVSSASEQNKKIFKKPWVMVVVTALITSILCTGVLGAFVLVHAGMMMVVFVLAETAGPVAYWPVVVLGNAFVMVLEALLVSIQVLRLEYYEMFNRFYAGEGRPYEPVKLKTN